MSLLGLVPFLKIAIMKSESTGNIIATMSPNVEIMISALRRRCVDKTVALLGSAPGKWDISDRPDIISGVNSSHINFGLKEVDILFFNTYSLYPAGKYKNVRESIAQRIEGTTCDLVVVIDAANTNPKLPFKYEQKVILNKADRNSILSQYLHRQFLPDTSGEEVPSTGIQAAISLRATGANPVLYGFSLTDGHYLSPTSARAHRDMDATLFGHFDIRAPFRPSSNK